MSSLSALLQDREFSAPYPVCVLVAGEREREAIADVYGVRQRGRLIFREDNVRAIHSTFAVRMVVVGRGHRVNSP